MKSILLLFTLFILTIAPTFTFAEIGAFKITNPEKPEIILQKGEILRVIWKDGREAIASKLIAPNLEVDVPSAIYENTCNSYIASRCALRPATRMYKVELQWSKHPDASKIGKVLIFYLKLNPSDKDPFIIAQDLQFAFSKVFKPLATRGLADDVVVCEDYKFLPQDPFQNPPLRILHWDTEAMVTNPETGGMENRSVAGAFDIDLIPGNSKSLVLQVKGGYTSAQGSPILVQGDVISWTMRNQNQQICQIGLKPNIAFLQAKFLEYLATLPHKYEPYIYESDEFSHSLTILNLVFDNPDFVIE